MRDHLQNLRLMLEKCGHHQVALKSKKCIFCTPFGILLGYIVCKKGLLVDPMKITIILIFPLHTNMKMLRLTLGHGVLSKVHTRVCYDHRSNGEVVEETCNICMESRVSRNFRHPERQYGFRNDNGFSWLEQGSPCPWEWYSCNQEKDILTTQLLSLVGS